MAHVNFEDEAEWQAAMANEAEMFKMNSTALADLMSEVEDEIATLQGQRQELLDVQADLREHKAAPLLESSAAIADAYLAKLRAVASNNQTVARASAEGKDAAIGPDGKAMKLKKDPELKLLHRLCIELKPAPLTPVPGALESSGNSAATTPSAAGGASQQSPKAAEPAATAQKKDKKPTASPFGSLLGALKSKLKTDDDREKERAKAAEALEPEAQAVCRVGARLERMPGLRAQASSPEAAVAGESVEVASVSFTLRSAPPLHGAPPLTAGDGDELAAYVNMTIHNALAMAAGATEKSGVVSELKGTSVMQHEKVQQKAAAFKAQQEAHRQAAKRVLDSMIIDVTAVPVPGHQPGALQAFTLTVAIRQRPVEALAETLRKITSSEEYRRRRATVEKAYAVLECFAANDFSVALDFGVAATPPASQLPEQREAALLEKRTVAKRKAETLWRTHKELLGTESDFAATVRETAGKQGEKIRAASPGQSKEAIARRKMEALVEAVRPPVSEAIDGFILPAVRRTVCPPTADPEPLSRARAAANLYAVNVRRAPREIVKLALNEVYDSAAAKAEARAANGAPVASPASAEEPSASPAGSSASGTSSGKGAAVKLAAAKAKVAAALALYDDLHFDVVPFPHKSANQKKRAAILLRRAELNTANAVGKLAEKTTKMIGDVMAARRVAAAVQEAEGNADNALRDAASVLAAVVRSIDTLTGSGSRGHHQLSRDTGRYDVTLCACEARSPMTARVVVKPPPSAGPGVEAVRFSVSAGLHPAPPLQRTFTGRAAGQVCRCDFFNAPLQLVLVDLVNKACDAVEEHSPLRDRFDV
jgi:hypothetical protein